MLKITKYVLVRFFCSAALKFSLQYVNNNNNSNNKFLYIDEIGNENANNNYT